MKTKAEKREIKKRNRRKHKMSGRGIRDLVKLIIRKS